MSSEGYQHCGKLHLYRDLGRSIEPGSAGWLEWVWSCPTCLTVLARQPFGFPKDIPELEQAPG